jgi:hypothetical protein
MLYAPSKGLPARFSLARIFHARRNRAEKPVEFMKNPG